jgi:hypothetical protein
MHQVREDWDNGPADTIIEGDVEDGDKSSKKTEAFHSLENCRDTCLADSRCVQFNYRTGRCAMSKATRLGYPSSEKMRSEWILERIDDFQKTHATCDVRWINPW